MSEAQTEFIDVSRLRIGHYVYMDTGWMSHPFPLNSFKIRSPDQIEGIRTLGLDRVRYSPQRSDPEAAAETARDGEDRPTPMPGGQAPKGRPRNARRELLAGQRTSLQKCERLFSEASRTFRRIGESIHSRPETAAETAQALVEGMTDQIRGEQESCIRLLSEKVGERSSLHAINVTVISLLLAKACGLDEAAMRDVGMGALLHDMGKAQLPDRLRYGDVALTAAEQQMYREHVRFGVEMAQKMKLPKGVLLAIAQHHECADGSGYPLQVGNGKISAAARIVALTDRYDNLCNPSNPGQALTPYEAMSFLYAQRRQCFDGPTLATFIRMMGVYPPGSVVQLSDGRFALVVSVNASRPLKPWVLIHDPSVPREEALVVDLGGEPELGIRRSLRPLQLPKATFDYLSPRQRVCYFFEHGRSVGEEGAA